METAIYAAYIRRGQIVGNHVRSVKIMAIETETINPLKSTSMLTLAFDDTEEDEPFITIRIDHPCDYAITESNWAIALRFNIQQQPNKELVGKYRFGPRSQYRITTRSPLGQNVFFSIVSQQDIIGLVVRLSHPDTTSWGFRPVPNGCVVYNKTLMNVAKRDPVKTEVEYDHKRLAIHLSVRDSTDTLHTESYFSDFVEEMDRLDIMSVFVRGDSAVVFDYGDFKIQEVRKNRLEIVHFGAFWYLKSADGKVAATVQHNAAILAITEVWQGLDKVLRKPSLIESVETILEEKRRILFDMIKYHSPDADVIDFCVTTLHFLDIV